MRVTDPNGDQIIENGKPKTSIKIADTPYTATKENYKINIRSNMVLTSNFNKYIQASDAEIAQNVDYTLQKTYVNEYSITYAMQAVKVERVEIKEGDGNKTLDQLSLQFFGVGDINVEITVNGITTNYTVATSEVLSFKDYGTYTVKMTDSMGTSITETFPYPKPISISSVLLIGLGGFIALVFVLFIIASRGKVKTR